MSKVLGAAIDAFFETVPPHVQYYGVGGNVAIPTVMEIAFLQVLTKTPPRTREDLVPIARRLTFDQATLLSAFSIRMAIHAVRTANLQVLSAGAIAMIMDDNLQDWRAILKYLSFLDDASARLGSDLSTTISDAHRLASDRRRETIDAYYSREPFMRGIAAMRFEAIGIGDTFCYRKVQS